MNNNTNTKILPLEDGAKIVLDQIPTIVESFLKSFSKSMTSLIINYTHLTSAVRKETGCEMFDISKDREIGFSINSSDKLIHDRATLLRDVILKEIRCRKINSIL